MFILSVRDRFSAAHRIESTERCEDLHGHNFTVEVSVSGKDLDKSGLLLDFRIIKDCLKKVLETLDHKYLNELTYFQERKASSEYIALYIFEEMEKMLDPKKVRLMEVKVFESEDSSASFRREDD